MKFFLTLLFLVPTICVAQSSSNFTLFLRMSNSVENGMYNLSIEQYNDRGNISVVYTPYSVVYSHGETSNEKVIIDIATVDTSALVPLKKFMDTYNYAYKEEINHPPGVYVIRVDGGHTLLTLDYDSTTRSTTFRDPYARNQNTELGEILVKLLYATFNKGATRSYIKNITGFFSLPYDFK